MKLVEVVIMTGVQCISPVENTPVKTEVGKVWCAVVVEKDTAANRVEVTPHTETANPAVRMALQRMDAQAGLLPKSQLLKIVPASALPEQRAAMLVPDAPSPDERIEPVARMDVAVPKPLPRPDDAAEAGLPQPEPEVVAALDEPSVQEPAVEEPPVKKVTSTKKRASSAKKKRTDICSPPRKAVWYTNKAGQRKYRCRRTAGLY